MLPLLKPDQLTDAADNAVDATPKPGTYAHMFGCNGRDERQMGGSIPLGPETGESSIWQRTNSVLFAGH